MRIVSMLLIVACQSSDGDRTPSKPDEDTPGVTEDDPGGPNTDSADTSDTGTVPLPTVSESFPYSAPVADVLFVVDNSGSMAGSIEVLIGALDGLVASWTARGIDFHVGATNIDEGPEQGKLIPIDGYRWADPTHATPGLLLMEMVAAVTDPSTVEQGSLAAYKALQMIDLGQPNEGFLREGTELAVIVITDETDQSGLDPVVFTDFLLGLRADPELVGFHSIVDSTDYLDLTATVGGIGWSVDNTPYGPALQAITDTIGATNLFTLAGEPVPETITATVHEPDGTDVELANEELDYDEETRVVDLEDYAPQDGAVVEIHYAPASEPVR